MYFLFTFWHWTPEVRGSNRPWRSHRPHSTFRPRWTAPSPPPGSHVWSSAEPTPSSSPRPRVWERSGSGVAGCQSKWSPRFRAPWPACGRPVAGVVAADVSPRGSALWPPIRWGCGHLFHKNKCERSFIKSIYEGDRYSPICNAGTCSMGFTSRYSLQCCSPPDLIRLIGLMS